jgi:hypothetical protein
MEAANGEEIFPVLQLPNDLQDSIYQCLTVDDRVRLRCALPPDARKRVPKPQRNEKRLGVLLKAIRKRRIVRLSRPATEFLRIQCARDDPTVAEIERTFPEITASLDRGSKTTLHDKLKDGSLLPADLASIEDDGDINVGLCHPASFDVLIGDERFARLASANKVSSIIIYGNTKLLEHLATALPGMYTAGMAHAHAYTVTYGTMWGQDSAAILLRHVAYSREELDGLWTKAMDDMEVEVAETIDAWIRQNPLPAKPTAAT